MPLSQASLALVRARGSFDRVVRDSARRHATAYRWPLSTTFNARTRLRGLQLVASDTGWSAGRGGRVDRPMEALLILLTGRTVALDLFSGPGVRQLTSAVH